MEIGKHGIMSYTFLLHRRRAWPREVGSLPRAVRTCGGGGGSGGEPCWGDSRRLSSLRVTSTRDP